MPLMWFDNRRLANDIDGFAIPSYVGDSRQSPESGAHESITSLAAVLGSTLAGIDKSDQHGRNYVSMLPLHFHRKDGIGLYLNQTGSRGASYWYDLLPNLQFLHIYGHYRDTPGFRQQLESVADAWRKVLQLNGSDFEHTGFNFIDNKPVKMNWTEADATAGIACLEYLAWIETENIEYLKAADQALDLLNRREENPFYECLMPYGATIAARSNAEQGTSYDTGQFIEWVLAGDNPRKWGAVLEKWHHTEAFGLIGSVYPEYEYAFAMNSFQAVGIMTPIARYQQQYARDLAKWILNVAVNARLFYANAWPADQQSSIAWARQYDPEFCIPYEGLRKQGTTRNYPESDQVLTGKLEPGNPEDLRKDFTLVADATGSVDYRATVLIPENGTHELIALVAHRKRWNNQKVTITVADNATLTYAEDGRPNFQKTAIPPLSTHECTIAVTASGLEPGAKVLVEDLVVETRFANPPHVGGDPTIHGWGATDLGLYGGAWVGFLAAMVEPTNVKGIIAIDPVATDMLPPKTFPTRLLYNPYQITQEVEWNVGPEKLSVYDALSDQFLVKAASGAVNISIPAKQAVMLVHCPEGAAYTRQGTSLLCDDVVIDYQTDFTP